MSTMIINIILGIIIVNAATLGLFVGGLFTAGLIYELYCKPMNKIKQY